MAQSAWDLTSFSKSRESDIDLRIVIVGRRGAMHDPDPRHVQLGHAMRAVRRQLGRSQTFLAGRMGCTRQHLSAFENGRDLPIPDTWHRWLDAVGATNSVGSGRNRQLHDILQRARKFYELAQPHAATQPDAATAQQPTVIAVQDASLDWVDVTPGQEDVRHGGAGLVPDAQTRITILNPSYPSKFSEQDVMDRLTFLQGVAAIAGASFFSGPQAKSLTSSRVDPDVVHELDRLIEVSWRLSQGEDFITLDYLLPTYLPRLTALAQEPSKHQRKLAALAAQGYLLAGLVMVLKGRPAAAKKQCSQAVLYSRLSNDHRLEVAALKHLATKYLDSGRPLDTISAYEQALPIIKPPSFDSPLLRSRTYLGLAVAHARCNESQEALRYLGMAKETFPEQPEDDPSFGYADCGLWSLNHYEGLLRIQLTQAAAALEEFERAMHLGVAIPQRTVVELLNCQAEAAVETGDIERACDRVMAGHEGAQRLGCDKRFADTFSVYKQMRRVWPREARVLELEGVFAAGSSHR